jgi:orotidine-5'-phosphate decarboxylase
MRAHEKIAFAMDVSSIAEASKFETLLEGHVGALKIGLELFISCPTFKTPIPTILDLKLHDIPETVARAVKAGGDKGAKYMTLHVQQRKTLEEAVKAAEPFGITLFGVTVLTSMNDDDCKDLGYVPLQPSTRAMMLAQHGYDCGLRGFVCSPQEVGKLKQAFPQAVFLVPGVRPAGSDAGDQKRVGTPAQAVRDGADLIVVGRPIRDAKDPVAAAKAIAAEIEAG